VIELPDDLFEANEVIALVRSPWFAGLQDLRSAGVKFEHSQVVMEVKTKATRKPRKPRLVETPPDKAA
jgi:hypothetical protein